MQNVKFCGILRQKDEFRGKFRGSNSTAKTQIPRRGSKFRGPRKTVGPNDKVPNGENGVVDSCTEDTIITE